ncbi:MAG: hypothetical protein LBS09_06835 [Bacteroidales bacterium]|nr:hypothetical protein [Bacteroidales bacterium]
MKKIILSFGILCMGFVATGQDFAVEEAETTDNTVFVNRRGIPVLPKAGDFALGIDATPFLRYLGNVANNTTGNAAPLFNGVSNTIYGKYFIADDRAIRAKLRLNIYQDQHKGTVANDAEVARNPLNPFATTVDVQRISTQDVALTAGYEFRRGRGRVQGFYGGEVSIGYKGGKTVYEYSNPLTALNQNPSTADFGANLISSGLSAQDRITEQVSGATLSASVAGFVGVEYFFAPQISIGGELNLGLDYSTKAQDEITAEGYDAANDKIQTYSKRERSKSDLAGTAGIRTITSGSIFLLFHF